MLATISCAAGADALTRESDAIDHGLLSRFHAGCRCVWCTVAAFAEPARAIKRLEARIIRIAFSPIDSRPHSDTNQVAPFQQGTGSRLVTSVASRAPLWSFSIVQPGTADQQGCAHRAARPKSYADYPGVSFENARRLQVALACRHGLTPMPAAVLCPVR